MEEPNKVREAIDGGHHVLYKVLVVPDPVHVPNQLSGNHIEDVLNGAIHWNVRPKYGFAHFRIVTRRNFFLRAFVGIFSRFDVKLTICGNATVFV